MAFALTAAGAALVAVTAADVLLTVLHPTRRGPLSYLVMRGGWAAIRALSRATATAAPMSFAGPLIMAAQFVTWIVGAWVGFALVYVAHLDALAYPADVPTGDENFLDALYLSATALTTVGFGDLVATTDALRLLSVLEAGSGLALITAAITYLLSAYPLVSQARTIARLLDQAQTSDRAAAEYVLAGGTDELGELHRELLAVDEDTERYPVLYYFHSQDPGATLMTMFRGAALVAMQLRWGLAAGALPGARFYGVRLTSTVEHMMGQYLQRFHHTSDLPDGGLNGIDAAERLRRLRDEAAEVAGARNEDGGEEEAFGAFVGRCDAFLEDLGRRHAYEYRPL